MNHVFKLLIVSFAGLILLGLILLGGCCGRTKGGKGKDTVVADTIAISPKAIIVTRPNAINVYVENSGSMDGYVKGVTEFEESVYSYLSDINILKITDSLKLFYINSNIIPQGTDIQDFIERLDPSTFRQRGGNRETSDIANVIKTVLNETKKDTVSILITDGIFSPGRNIDAGQYLINQQIGIKNSVAQYLNYNTNAAVIVYQLSSKFNGTYYDKEDNQIQINEQRPFYIWVIGDAEQVNELRNKIPDSKFKGGGVKNVFSIIAGNKPVNYAVKQGSGEFKLDRKDPKKTIVGLKRVNRGKNKGNAIFSVNVKLSEFLLDDNYLQDLSNYELNDRDFTLSSVAKAENANYTHSLNLSSGIIKKNSSLSIKLLTKIPQWVEDVNDSDGSAPVAGKTYGIKYQIHGVYEAFTMQNNYYTEIRINIK